MDFYSGEKAGDLRPPAGDQEATVIPQPMVNPVKPNGMQSGIAQINFQPGAGRRIVIEHGGNVFTNLLKEVEHSSRHGRWNRQCVVAKRLKQDTCLLYTSDAA